MILLTLSRGKGEETVRLQLPASPAEIGEAFASLDRISLDTTATAILDVSSNVPVLYRCLYDVDVEDSEQFQKLQKLAERTEALSPAKAAIFSGALDAECVWNLEGALTVADRLDEYTASRRVNGTFYLLGEEMTLEQFCEEHDLAYPQDNREFVLRPASLDEVGLFYSEEKLDEALGTVGHLRMDFGHGEKEFWHTWWPHNEDRFNTPEFKGCCSDLWTTCVRLDS